MPVLGLGTIRVMMPVPSTVAPARAACVCADYFVLLFVEHNYAVPAPTDVLGKPLLMTKLSIP